MDDGTGSEEQQRLEERMGEEVEEACRVGARTHRSDHVPELADRRVGEHLLDVVLDDGEEAHEEEGQAADHDDDVPHIAAEHLVLGRGRRGTGDRAGRHRP